MMIKDNNLDIWTTCHWWGWKIHFTQDGLDLLSNRLQAIRYLRNQFCYGYFSRWIIILIYFFVYVMSNKIKNIKCKNDDCFISDHKNCSKIKIKEVNINFFWLPFPVIPVKTKVIT